MLSCHVQSNPLAHQELEHAIRYILCAGVLLSASSISIFAKVMGTGTRTSELTELVSRRPTNVVRCKANGQTSHILFSAPSRGHGRVAARSCARRGTRFASNEPNASPLTAKINLEGGVRIEVVHQIFAHLSVGILGCLEHLLRLG